MCLQVQYGKESIWVRLVAVDLYGTAEQRLRQYNICEFRKVEKLRVDVEELAQEVLEAMEINGRLRIKPFEIDIYHVHVLDSILLAIDAAHSERGKGACLVAAGVVVILLLALVRRIGQLFGVSFLLSFRHCVLLCHDTRCEVG